MKNYFELLKKLAFMDRCHCGPEMSMAYDYLIKYYSGSRKLHYQCGEDIYGWEIPPYWECNDAKLLDSSGKIIADKSRNNLEVFSYSPPYEGEISLEELNEHLLSDPNRPDAILFHFRNQYRHRNAEWGFSLPYKIRKGLKDEKYYVKIDSYYDYSKKMIQADFLHKGKTEKEYLFMGHFDHPSMVNDGLSGCLASFEVINRLKERNTKFSYRAFASIEIVGSVAYLEKELQVRKNINEGLFLGFSGIDSPIVYQQSFGQKSRLDEVVKHLLNYTNSNSSQRNIYNHREIAGNDENVFDSIGYEIPMGTLMRSPFNQYHTHFDNLKITQIDKIEEIINFVLKIIDIIENDSFLIANYQGIPSLSNPDFNLYLGPERMSGIISDDQFTNINIDRSMYKDEFGYVEKNKNLLYPFMNNILRLADGKHTLLEICNISKIPFSFGITYVKALERKNLINLIDV